MILKYEKFIDTFCHSITISHKRLKRKFYPNKLEKRLKLHLTLPQDFLHFLLQLHRHEERPKTEPDQPEFSITCENLVRSEFLTSSRLELTTQSIRFSSNN